MQAYKYSDILCSKCLMRLNAIGSIIVEGDEQNPFQEVTCYNLNCANFKKRYFYRLERVILNDQIK